MNSSRNDSVNKGRITTTVTPYEQPPSESKSRVDPKEKNSRPALQRHETDRIDRDRKISHNPSPPPRPTPSPHDVVQEDRSRASHQAVKKSSRASSTRPQAPPPVAQDIKAQAKREHEKVLLRAAVLNEFAICSGKNCTKNFDKETLEEVLDSKPRYRTAKAHTKTTLAKILTKTNFKQAANYVYAMERDRYRDPPPSDVQRLLNVRFDGVRLHDRLIAMLQPKTKANPSVVQTHLHSPFPSDTKPFIAAKANIEAELPIPYKNEAEKLTCLLLLDVLKGPHFDDKKFAFLPTHNEELRAEITKHFALNPGGFILTEAGQRAVTAFQMEAAALSISPAAIAHIQEHLAADLVPFVKRPERDCTIDKTTFLQTFGHVTQDDKGRWITAPGTLSSEGIKKSKDPITGAKKEKPNAANLGTIAYHDAKGATRFLGVRSSRTDNPETLQENLLAGAIGALRAKDTECFHKAPDGSIEYRPAITSAMDQSKPGPGWKEGRYLESMAISIEKLFAGRDRIPYRLQTADGGSKTIYICRPVLSNRVLSGMSKFGAGATEDALQAGSQPSNYAKLKSKLRGAETMRKLLRQSNEQLARECARAIAQKLPHLRGGEFVDDPTNAQALENFCKTNWLALDLQQRMALQGIYVRLTGHFLSDDFKKGAALGGTLTSGFDHYKLLMCEVCLYRFVGRVPAWQCKSGKDRTISQVAIQIGVTAVTEAGLAPPNGPTEMIAWMWDQLKGDPKISASRRFKQAADAFGSDVARLAGCVRNGGPYIKWVEGGFSNHLGALALYNAQDQDLPSAIGIVSKNVKKQRKIAKKAATVGAKKDVTDVKSASDGKAGQPWQKKDLSLEQLSALVDALLNKKAYDLKEFPRITPDIKAADILLKGLKDGNPLQDSDDLEVVMSVLKQQLRVSTDCTKNAFLTDLLNIAGDSFVIPDRDSKDTLTRLQYKLLKLFALSVKVPDSGYADHKNQQMKTSSVAIVVFSFFEATNTADAPSVNKLTERLIRAVGKQENLSVFEDVQKPQ
jgi:hypothetical protein